MSYFFAFCPYIIYNYFLVKQFGHTTETLWKYFERRRPAFRSRNAKIVATAGLPKNEISKTLFRFSFLFLFPCSHFNFRAPWFFVFLKKELILMRFLQNGMQKRCFFPVFQPFFHTLPKIRFLRYVSQKTTKNRF